MTKLKLPGTRIRTAAASVAVAVALAAGLGVAAVTSGPPAQAHTAQAVTSAITPQVACSALLNDDFLAVPDAITELSSATTVTFNGGQFCQVEGYIAPQTQFQADLPVSTWQGDYLQLGCGGRCGNVTVGTPYQSDGCVQVTGDNLVLASDDMGHTGISGASVGGSGDSAWAANEPDLRAVFGITSEHQTAQAVKAIIRAYYGQGPAYSYYDGCSDGGKEAMDEAEYWPEDFNGIIAGSPVLFFTEDNAELHGWEDAVNTNAQGQSILTQAKLPALHAAVMAKCANAQGLIVNPVACDFNPASIECPAGVNSNSCLTPAQVTVVRDFYTGPVVPGGDGNLYPGGLPYGSELGWTSDIAPAGEPAIDDMSGEYAIQYLRYMAWPDDPPAWYSLPDYAHLYSGPADQFHFTAAGFDSLQTEAATYNASDPDLSAFDADGGKLIMYDGWAAASTPPFSTLAYYTAMARYMGGWSASQAFSRLYLVPGAGHCLDSGAGYLNVSPDFLTAVINWVQNGQAPGSYTLPVTGAVAPTTLTSLTISPYDPFTPVEDAPDGLNSNYRYVGTIAPGVDTGSLASIPPGLLQG